MSEMWSETYRPQSLADCVLNHLDDKSQKLLQNSVTLPEIPNIILFGPPGTGKTTIARILCDSNRFTVNEFNGYSLEKQNLSLIERLIVYGNLFHRCRCLLIDEIDSSTDKAQLALRSLLQETRVPLSWICTANNINKLNTALLSRFIEIDCSHSSPKQRHAHISGIVERCETILRYENITSYSNNEIQELVELYYPDVRKTINMLQATYARPIAA